MNIPRFRDPALGGWVGGALYYFKVGSSHPPGRGAPP
jgi:hypothetical protein